MFATKADNREHATLPETNAQTRNKRILFVDSDESYRLILSTLLLEEGYNVVTSGNTQEAIHLFEKEPFDFVITEHQGSVLDGLRLLERIKQLNTNVPVLLISSQYEMEPYIEAMNLGALDYFSKPIDYVEVQRLVKFH